MPSDDVTKSDAMRAYRGIYDLMKENQHQLWAEAAPCRKCRKECNFSGKVKLRNLRLLIAGTECKAWSTQGKNERCAHPSMLVFLVFLFDLQHQCYDVAIHEITELHPEELLPHFTMPRLPRFALPPRMANQAATQVHDLGQVGLALRRLAGTVHEIVRTDSNNRSS